MVDKILEVDRCGHGGDPSGDASENHEDPQIQDNLRIARRITRRNVSPPHFLCGLWQTCYAENFISSVDALVPQRRSLWQNPGL